jgi:signal peptidase I
MYILKAAVLTTFITLVIRGFFLVPVMVEGHSMEGNLSHGDMMLVNKFSSAKRFDVAVVKLDSGEVVVKRIIGLPGDDVKFVDNQLFINGKKTNEEFLNPNLSFTNDFDLLSISGYEKLQPKTFFVLGDNRPRSRDSRSFGVVKQKQILGIAKVVYYPFRDAKIL